MTSDLSPVDRLNEIRLRRLAAAEAWASTSLSWSETVERTIASSADVGWLLEHIEQLQAAFDELNAISRDELIDKLRALGAECD